MTNLYHGEEGAHWYYDNGRPCYEIPLKTDPSRTRAPTIVDARQLGLSPGTTNITKMMDKPALNVYKVNQHLLAAMTLPRQPSESEASFMRRVLLDAKEHGEKAASFGTRIHDYAEWLLRGRATPEPIRFMSDVPVLAELRSWMERHPIEVLTADVQGVEVPMLEYSFCNKKLGYGGRLDIVGVIECLDDCGLVEALGELYREPMIIDFKSQETKPDLLVNGTPGKNHHRFRKYPEHKMQGAAYAQGVGMQDLPGACIYVSRSLPGLIEVAVTPSPIEDGTWWWAFQACKVLFYTAGPGSNLAYEWSAEEIAYFESAAVDE